MIDFRKAYRPLSADEEKHLDHLKVAAEVLDLEFSYIDTAFGEGARHVALARTHLETAVMFAVKALTA